MTKTKAQGLQDSVVVKENIQKLVAEVTKHSAGLNGIRAPDAARKDHMKELSDKIHKVRGRPLLYSYVGSGLGRGPYAELEDGSVKLDFINGIGIHILGHSHPRVVAAALAGSLSDVMMQGNLEPNREYYEYSEKLVQIASRNSRLKHVWLSTCGTMANENALKACRQKRNAARIVIAMNNAFAGRSTMMAEITDNPGFKQGLPDYNEVVRVPWYDKNQPRSSEQSLAILKEHVAKHGSNVGCFTFEPMQGEGGYNVAPREYFLPMLDFCKQHNIPIWLDEVQTFMRTGQFFAFETLGLGSYVDVCTIAKTAQNGATFFTEEMNPKPGLISGTFSGSTPALSAGLEIMKIMDEEGYMGPDGKIMAIHNEFVGGLNKLNETTCKGLLRDAGGMGLMVAVTPLDGTKEKVDKLMQKLFEHGLVCFNCGRGTYRLRFLIPAIVESKDIQQALAIIEKSIQEIQ